MDIITTSLEALIQRATSVHNQGADTAAIEAFCGLVNKEPESTQTASRLIIAKAHSLKEWEALQALLVLENCVKKCGMWFQNEVGKFRFLNELIKLVSPKYLGAHTAESVKRRVLDLMGTWSTELPNQPKIKEAYIMLRKQGVVQDGDVLPSPGVSSSPAPVVEPREKSCSIFQDEEKSLLLQKLLRSSNPVDLQAANRLIKTMVKEDEKRVEEKWRRRVELETVVNNCSLLREMLCCYENGTSSSQDRQLIDELHTTCTNLRPVLIRLANNPDPSFTCDVLSANDELGEVLTKYKEVMSESGRAALAAALQSSLLDLTSPDRPQISSPLSVSTPHPHPHLPPLSTRPPGDGVDLLEDSERTCGRVDTQSSSLDDILSLVPCSHPTTVAASSLQPQSTPQSSQSSGVVNKAGVDGGTAAAAGVGVAVKPKGLEELDLLGENLLKQILSNSGQQQISKRNSGKVSMNELLLNGSNQNKGGERTNGGCVESNDVESEDVVGRLSPAMSSDSGYEASCNNNIGGNQGGSNMQSDCLSTRSDEPLLCLGDIESALDSVVQKPQASATSDSYPPPLPDDRLHTNDSDDVNLLGSPASSQHENSPQTPASLATISVSLDSIKPSGLAPWTAVSDADGLTIVVTLASDRPRADVSVFVVTTTSRSKQPITDYQLKPILPKKCKVRLLEPTTRSLPPFNPFIPPAAIVHILLIASLTKEPLNLKLVISYTMDEETVTDVAQIDQLQLSE